MASDSPDADPRDSSVARALSDQGEAALQNGDPTAAAALLADAVARWRGTGDAAGLARALYHRGLAHTRLGEPRRALLLLAEAAALFGEDGAVVDEAAARHALGEVYRDLAAYPQARLQIEAALALYRRAADPAGEQRTLALLAPICRKAGDRLAAVDYGRAYLQAVRAAGDAPSEAAALVALAELLADAGYDAASRAALAEAVAIYEALGLLRETGETLLALAQVYFDGGDWDAAVAPVQKALPLLRDSGAWGPRAVQWQHFLFSRQVPDQARAAMQQWRRGDPHGLDALIAAAREQIAAAGSASPNPVVDQLLAYLSDAAAQLAAHPPPPRAPAPSTDALAAQDTRSTPDLIAALAAPQAPERRKAALALGVRGDHSAVVPLIALCADRNQWVRMAAVRSLGKLKDRRALDALCVRVVEDRDKEVRRSAAAALGLLGDARAVPALSTALTDPFFRAVESAEKALRKLKAAPDPAALLALLAHPDVVRRYSAALRLAGLGDRQAIAPLAREAVNPDQPVEARAAFLKALGALPDPRSTAAALRVLDGQPPAPGASPEDPDPGGVLKAAALRLLARADTADLGSLTPRLVAYLGDAAPAVRHAAVEALGAVGDAAAIPALERVQQADDAVIPAPGRAGPPHTRLRSAAAEAITRIRARAAG